MLARKTYFGERLDLEHYKGYPVIDFSIEILDSAGDPYIYPDNAASITFELFAKKHGKSLEVIELDIPVSPSYLTLNTTTSVMDKRPSVYYHECYITTDESPAEKILLFHGVSEII